MVGAGLTAKALTEVLLVGQGGGEVHSHCMSGRAGCTRTRGCWLGEASKTCLHMAKGCGKYPWAPGEAAVWGGNGWRCCMSVGATPLGLSSGQVQSARVEAMMRAPRTLEADLKAGTVRLGACNRPTDQGLLRSDWPLLMGKASLQSSDLTVALGLKSLLWEQVDSRWMVILGCASLQRTKPSGLHISWLAAPTTSLSSSPCQLNCPCWLKGFLLLRFQRPWPEQVAFCQFI